MAEANPKNPKKYYYNPNTGRIQSYQFTIYENHHKIDIYWDGEKCLSYNGFDTDHLKEVSISDEIESLNRIPKQYAFLFSSSSQVGGHYLLYETSLEKGYDKTLKLYGERYPSDQTAEITVYAIKEGSYTSVDGLGCVTVHNPNKGKESLFLWKHTATLRRSKGWERALDRIESAAAGIVDYAEIGSEISIYFMYTFENYNEVLEQMMKKD